jgi:hypothetical protein
MANIERDHHPEVVVDGKGMRRLEVLGIAEQLTTPAARRKFFAELGDDGYEAMLHYSNSTTRRYTN